MHKNKEIVERCKEDIQQLKCKIDALRGDPESASQVLPDVFGEIEQKSSSIFGQSKLSLKQRRTLTGHFGKIYALQWAKDSKRIVSASQDGRLKVWDAFARRLLFNIAMRSSHVMTCAYSPTGRFVAQGGLDNMCNIHDLKKRSQNNDNWHPCIEFSGHSGYVSSIRWMSQNTDEFILTASGDATCILWDVEHEKQISCYDGHEADVMAVSTRENIFVTGSCDNSVRLWDIRVPIRNSCVQVIGAHTADVNTVQFFPDAEITNVVGSGSDDGSCRLFDIRSKQQLGRYAQSIGDVPKPPALRGYVYASVTFLDFSRSGRYIFASSDDYHVYVWNTLTAKLEQVFARHNGRVSCVGVSVDGKAIATGSWDTTLQIWA